MGNCCIARTLDAEEQIALDGVKRFTFDELRHATHDFNESIGKGGSRIVYIGWVDEESLAPLAMKSGMQVAVKRLSRNNPRGQSVAQWLAERTYLAQLRHPNIIRLVGFCCDSGGEHMLVYKYMSNRSLDRLLFIDHGRLEWKFRLRALYGIARGLAHLHNQTPNVIYIDLKPSKILLDQDYNGVLADSRIARDCLTRDHVTTETIGTTGYVCPYYVATGHLTTKVDVYSFGVILLEVLSGRAVIDPSRPPGKRNLTLWVLPDIRRGAFPEGFLDTEIQECPIEMLVRLRELVRGCLQHLPVDRPTMDEVITELSQ